MLRTLLALAASTMLIATQAHGRITTRPALIEDVKVTPQNGGINPDAFAYVVEGKILAGSNPCQARGVSVSLEQTKVRGVVHVMPTIKEPRRNGPRICTREWSPVYKHVRMTIRGMHSRIDDIVIHNIGQLGDATSIKDLLEQGEVVAMSGTLTRIMAIGGETTGIAIILSDGETVEIDLVTNNLDRMLEDLENRSVRVTGIWKTVLGVEIPSRQVLVAETLEAQEE